jgi:nickel-dependent lactate racemase
MAVKRVRMNVNAFFGDDEIDLAFPETWNVTECRMAGHNTPPLSDEAMRQALRNPVGAPRLRALAKDKHEVCIVFDDLPKPTPVSRIVPFVLDELHAGGIRDAQIRFVCGPGTHRFLTYPEFVAKLGSEIVERYPVYNHSIWENLIDLGQTSRGTPVSINREYAACDLRIAIGSVFPHGSAGFGGGGKIILPGIAGYETINYHHENRKGHMFKIEGNVHRMDIEEAARMADLHFKVDAVLNNRREVIGLFAGDFIQEHRAGVSLARQMYCTETVSDVDVLVLNSYPDECQIGRATWPIPLSLKDGGEVVVLCHSWEGQNLHQRSSRFGTDYGGRGYKPQGPRALRNSARARKILVLAPHMSRYDRDNLGEKAVWHRTWADVLADLAGRYGSGTTVGVYPYAPLQIPLEASSMT